MFENPRRGRQARNFTTNVPKILDLKFVVWVVLLISRAEWEICFNQSEALPGSG